MKQLAKSGMCQMARFCTICIDCGPDILNNGVITKYVKHDMSN
jgi:hypothetical protein